MRICQLRPPHSSSLGLPHPIASSQLFRKRRLQAFSGPIYFIFTFIFYLSFSSYYSVLVLLLPVAAFSYTHHLFSLPRVTHPQPDRAPQTGSKQGPLHHHGYSHIRATPLNALHIRSAAATSTPTSFPTPRPQAHRLLIPFLSLRSALYIQFLSFLPVPYTRLSACPWPVIDRLRLLLLCYLVTTASLSR